VRRAAHVDANHAQVMAALRKLGATAKSLAGVGKGMPDILAGFRGVNVLLEVKNPEAERGQKQAMQLTADEQAFHDTWAGQVAVVTSPEEAVRVVAEAAR
jgi:hypothetical protein